MLTIVGFIREECLGCIVKKLWGKWNFICLTWGCLRFGLMTMLGSNLRCWGWWGFSYWLQKILSDLMMIIVLFNKHMYKGDYILFSKSAHNKVLDVSQSNYNFGNLVLYDYHGEGNQIFNISQVTESNSPFYIIQSKKSKKVLTV